jgi:hypothetical protein
MGGWEKKNREMEGGREGGREGGVHVVRQPRSMGGGKQGEGDSWRYG